MNLNKFGFTANIEQDLFNKVSQYTELKELLNSKLEITKYTNLLNKILFVFIALNPQNLYKVENFQRFRRKEKIVEIGINLDYNRLLQSDEDETLELLAETYLKGIEKYLIVRKDFDGQRFYNDVKQVFQENGILKQDRLQLV